MSEMVAKIGMASNVSASQAQGVHAQQVPLAFAPTGQTLSILKVRDNDDMHHHLENLGFVEGAAISIANESGGNMIVEVKGSQVAIDRQIALKIVVAVR